MIIKWPSKIKRNSTCNNLVTSVDFYPTLTWLSGGKSPNNQILDGRSLTTLLNGNDFDEERAIYSHYPVCHHDVPDGAIRKGNWKLIEYFTDYKVELYNLVDDI